MSSQIFPSQSRRHFQLLWIHETDCNYLNGRNLQYRSKPHELHQCMVERETTADCCVHLFKQSEKQGSKQLPIGSFSGFKGKMVTEGRN